MKHLVLHSPSSRAHLEELKDRLSRCLADEGARRSLPVAAEALIETVARVVQAMDRGLLSPDDVPAVLSSFDIPGFHIQRWLDDMVDEGIYLEAGLAQAA